MLPHGTNEGAETTTIAVQMPHHHRIELILEHATMGLVSLLILIPDETWIYLCLGQSPSPASCL